MSENEVSCNFNVNMNCSVKLPTLILSNSVYKDLNALIFPCGDAFLSCFWTISSSQALCLMLTLSEVPTVVSSHHMSLPQITGLRKCHGIELYLWLFTGPVSSANLYIQIDPGRVGTGITGSTV